jgi:hypothetical protein
MDKDLTAIAEKDKDTKNTERFVIPQESMSGAGFSGSIYVPKGTVSAGKRLEVTIKQVD